MPARFSLCLALLVTGVAADGGEDRLGSLIRWYLDEPTPVRREKFLQSIEDTAGGDVRIIIKALRDGRHFRHDDAPALKKGGPAPVFSLKRPRLQPVGASAGDFAQLVVPRGYTPKRAYPLMIDIGPVNLPPADGAILLRVLPELHPQAREHAWAAEGLVLSLLAHVMEVVHVDPDRVSLRADGKPAALAWYVALHNPDRFAAVLTARVAWKGGGAIACNAATFGSIGVRKHGSDRPLASFFAALRRHSARHAILEASPEEPLHKWIAPYVEKVGNAARVSAPTTLRLATERSARVRSFWVRMSPRTPSTKPRRVGPWRDRALARTATLTATLDNTKNRIDVKTYRVTAFDIYIDAGLFDPSAPLRVSINGSVPESKLIYPEIADLLEDYRVRRDTGLLFVDKLTFAVR
ncbi:MAG: PHB depolymerase family esterase [Planctomycetota bacterium]|nr:PHB depolymerase family esterase [Planctomycetota bacterium]